MHGDLEPDEHILPDTNHVNDLWEDMDRLNALYEEMMWPHDDVIEFVPDHRKSRIIIRNRSAEEREAQRE
jgi:hypothetical protein|tara:strand:- start:47 stop:256 length:210 start_codon:yes stop_codon:yes gene_type:complete